MFTMDSHSFFFCSFDFLTQSNDPSAGMQTSQTAVMRWGWDVKAGILWPHKLRRRCKTRATLSGETSEDAHRTKSYTKSLYCRVNKSERMTNHEKQIDWLVA